MALTGQSEQTPQRFLLDQNFPKPPEGLVWERLEASVSLSHFSDAFPSYAKTSTPDWMLYLLARGGGFDAVVTGDRSQLSQDEELVCLNEIELNLVTWVADPKDPIQMYGQLLAFMPQIRAALNGKTRQILSIPSATLKLKEHIERAGDLLRARKVLDGTSFAERRGLSLQIMRDELRARSERALVQMLG